MKSPTMPDHLQWHQARQRGIVLFFTLIALVAMSLAALALFRSVDTATLISGNLAFKQAATASADSGVESAITWLNKTQDDTDPTSNVLNDPTHPFNIDNPAEGYYTSALAPANLTSEATWGDDDENKTSKKVGAGPDGSGNTIRYIIQRMCRDAGVPIQDTTCLFSEGVVDNNGQHVRVPQEVCRGTGCPTLGQSPQIRITVRVTGPRNTVSYVQAFVY